MNNRETLLAEKKRILRSMDLVQTADDRPLATPFRINEGPYGKLEASSGALVRSKEFDEEMGWDGPLGVAFEDGLTILRLWAPTAAHIELELWSDATLEAELVRSIPMILMENKVWELRLRGNHHGQVYSYRVNFADGVNHSSADPYSRGAAAEGERSVMIDPLQVSLDGFERMTSFSKPTDAIIYEVHVRDFSIDDYADSKYPGKFLGLAEENLRTLSGEQCGLDYLKKLGVSHVQLLPIFDFYSLDGDQPRDYNWGYDPRNFNAPQNSYGSKKEDAINTILELKQTIKALHDAGLRVIMDVVYNHVYEVNRSSLHKTVPGYYFRYDNGGNLSNGTGVGNDTASERRMMRRYMVDSLRYWLTECHLDGFRFDLMGIHDVETMKAIRAMADEIDPGVLILGEGWNLATSLPMQERAWQGNAYRMPGIAHFNDALRDGIKGSTFDAANPGFVGSAYLNEDSLAATLTGHRPPYSMASYQGPCQMVQYCEAHDNLTMYDKLLLTNPSDKPEERRRRNRLALAMVLLSQGIRFIHGGQEFLRTKKGEENSYRSPDEINRYDWCWMAKEKESLLIAQKLIALVKDEPLFHLDRLEEIEERTSILRAAYGEIVFLIKGDDHQILVAFNGSTGYRSIDLPSGKWTTLMKAESFKREEIQDSKITMEGLTTFVAMGEYI